MTDLEQALGALLILTSTWAIYMTWMAYGMSATIRMLRRQPRQSPDPYGRGLQPTEPSPTSRFDPLRPVRCTTWWLLFCDLKDDAYRVSNEDEVPEILARTLVVFGLALLPSIVLAVVIGWPQILWSVFAIPAFWIVRLWARPAFHLRSDHTDDETYTSLRDRLLR